MNRAVKLLTAVLGAVLLGTLLRFPAYAANYKITSVTWASSVDGAAEVYWEHSNEKADETAWKIRLYRGSEGKPISKWITTKKDHFDFSVLISRKGTGRYYVEVYPVKGGQDYMVTSEYLVVDGVEMDSIKKWVKQQSENQKDPNTAFGWIKNPDGSWFYRFNDGTYATGWQQIGGETYYFSSNRIMLTGWQVIKNRWYYFDTESGKMFRNTTAPGGYSVNADGMLCVDGAPVDASFQPKNTEKNAARTLTNLTTIKITSKETKVAPNVVRPMTVTSDGKFSVETYEFSQPYEEWKPGVPITVTCTICANTGYCFTDNTEVTFNRGKLNGFSGNAVERIVTYTYYPRLVLPSPANVSIGSDGFLRWSPCKNAVQYILKINDGGEQLADIYVNTNKFDFIEYDGRQDVTVSIQAIAPESVRNYYYDSFETKISDLDTIKLNGTLIQTSDSLRYSDDCGNRVDGWVELFGEWFHFSNGFASGPGWWMDKDNRWYYFDSSYHMMTGEITDNGKTYFLNDGSRTDLPLGALVQ